MNSSLRNTSVTDVPAKRPLAVRVSSKDRKAQATSAGRSARPATGALQDGTLPQASGGGGSGSLSAESSAADLGLLSCGLFEDELEELLLSHSPKTADAASHQLN